MNKRKADLLKPEGAGTWVEITLERTGDGLLVSALGGGGEHPDPHLIEGRWDEIAAFAQAAAHAAQFGKPLNGPALKLASALHDEIFQGRVGELVQRLRGVAGRTPLLVRLMVREPALQAVPWEALCESGADMRFVGSSPHLLVTRGVHTSDPCYAREVEGAVRVLAISPSGEQAIQHVKDALQDEIEAGAIEWLPPVVGEAACLPYLFDRLGDEPHVIHFVGHGGLYQNKPALQLYGDPGEEPMLLVEPFAQRLASRFTERLRLVVLESCETARPGAFAGAAELLGQAGADAVIAHLWPVRADVARSCSRAVYRALAGVRQCTADVATAVRDMRQSILAEHEGSAEAFSPVLYLRGMDPVLFTFPEHRQLEPSALPATNLGGASLGATTAHTENEPREAGGAAVAPRRRRWPWVLGSIVVVAGIAAFAYTRMTPALSGNYDCSSESTAFLDCRITRSDSGQLWLSFNGLGHGTGGLLDSYSGPVDPRRCGLSASVTNEFSADEPGPRQYSLSRLEAKCSGDNALVGDWTFADRSSRKFRMVKVRAR